MMKTPIARFATHIPEFDPGVLPDDDLERRRAIEERAKPRETKPRLGSSVSQRVAELDAAGAEAFCDIEEFLYQVSEFVKGSE